MSADEPLYSQPLVGFRCWTITDEGHLSGIANRTAWRPERTMLSACIQYGHVEPTANCSCGLYAYYTADKPDVRRFPVIGVVIGRGHAELHRTGFRVEEAQIVALALTGKATPQQQQQIKQIAAAHGVPVVTIPQLTDIAQQYGPLFNPKTLPVVSSKMTEAHYRSQKRDDLLDIFRALNIFYGMLLGTLIIVMAMILIYDPPLVGAAHAEPVKDTITRKVLQKPPSSLFMDHQSLTHPNTWHLAPPSDWERSKWIPWLANYVTANSRAIMPSSAISQTQKVRWWQQQAKALLQERSHSYYKHRILRNIVMVMVPLWFVLLLLYEGITSLRRRAVKPAGA